MIRRDENKERWKLIAFQKSSKRTTETFLVHLLWGYNSDLTNQRTDRFDPYCENRSSSVYYYRETRLLSVRGGARLSRKRVPLTKKKRGYLFTVPLAICVYKGEFTSF